MREERKIAQGVGWESTKERDIFEERGTDGRMESKWILGR
jgi:hypothetical protein